MFSTATPRLLHGATQISHWTEASLGSERLSFAQDDAQPPVNRDAATTLRRRWSRPWLYNIQSRACSAAIPPRVSIFWVDGFAQQEPAYSIVGGGRTSRRTHRPIGAVLKGVPCSASTQYPVPPGTSRDGTLRQPPAPVFLGRQHRPLKDARLRRTATRKTGFSGVCCCCHSGTTAPRWLGAVASRRFRQNGRLVTRCSGDAAGLCFRYFQSPPLLLAFFADLHISPPSHARTALFHLSSRCRWSRRSQLIRFPLLDAPCNPSSNQSSLSSSPAQYPTDLPHPIFEEGDETDSEAVNEPLTPVSGRQSQDFQALSKPDGHHLDTAHHEQLASVQTAAAFPATRQGTALGPKPPLSVDTSAAPPSSAILQSPQKTPQTAALPSTPPPPTPSVDQEPAGSGPPSRRTTFGSTSNFRRTMSSFLRRGGSQTDKAAFGVDGNSAPSSTPNLQDAAPPRKVPIRRWSMNRSSATTRSNTPPSPGSPLEMAIKTKEEASKPTVPSSEAFKKKARTATGFSLRSRPAIAGGKATPSGQEVQLRRRASSFDYSKQEKPLVPEADKALHMERSLWGLPAETGTGVKARRMSLSLPDDFTIDVIELASEFEYQHKLLGRHGKHLGKGATSKVTLMVAKNGGELYAVKEFRGKSSSETREEYEKKIKSEYTLAKSLHHPNVVDTVRLCIDHGRWNHVMEYCEDGDLFSLVNKKYLKTEDREKDRLCLFKQLVTGIHYLHTNGVAHRDIKLENLLITRDSRLKITDFGVSEVFSGIHPGVREAGGQCGRNMGEVRRCTPGICGSMPYISPEVLNKQAKYDPRGLDVWSSAIVMVNLIFGGPLWHKAEVAENAPPRDTYASLVRGWAKWKNNHVDDPDNAITDIDYPHVFVFDTFVKPPALRRVLLQMLNPNPEERISIANVVNNRWVKNIECCQPENYDEPSAANLIDASKKPGQNRVSGRKIFCHNHLPPKEHNTHSLGKMPGSAGY